VITLKFKYFFTILLLTVSGLWAQDFLSNLGGALRSPDLLESVENNQIRESDILQSTDDSEVQESAEEDGVPELSSIEQIFMVDSDSPLTQFGYDYILSDGLDDAVLSNNAYILGVGDTLKAYLWGDPVDLLELQGQYNITVEQNGSLYFPAVGLLNVVGKSVAQVQDMITAGLKNKYRNFNLELAVSEFKSFSISISGMVNKPGQVRSTSFSSLVDIIGRAEGISKQGSLRDIELHRLDETYHFDLYDILIKGNGEAANFLIREGDSIYVNPIGPVAAIRGGVKRPAIYELAMGETIEDLFNYAGGSLVSTIDRNLSVYQLDNNSGSLVSVSAEISDILQSPVKDGMIIHVPQTSLQYGDSVRVNGTLRNPGRFDLASNRDLQSLLQNLLLSMETDMNYATVIRHKNEEKEIIPFSPQDVRKGSNTLLLEPMDEVIFYPQWAYKPIIISGEIEESQLLNYIPGITLLNAFRGIRLTAELQDLRVRIVQDSGINHVYLSELLSAGNPQADIPLEPGASILVQRVKQRENRNQIKLLGNVQSPGIVNFREGMTLYDLLSESGGLKDEAYLPGLVLFRESARATQKEQLDITLNTMTTQLETLKMEAQNSSISPEALAAVAAEANIQESLLELTRQKAERTLGRISLSLPDTLEELKESPDNIILEKEDYVFVPKKPDYVMVLGNVYNQISLRYSERTRVKGYLNQIGGTKDDSGRVYIVHLDGRVTSADSLRGLRRIKNQRLAPGDVIVVPQEIKVPGHIQFFDAFVRITDVLYKTSTSVLSTYAMLTALGAY